MDAAADALERTHRSGQPLAPELPDLLLRGVSRVVAAVSGPTAWPKSTLCSTIRTVEELSRAVTAMPFRCGASAALWR